MSVILFVAFPEPGHLHPMLSVAQRLAEDGHTLAYFSTEDVAARAAAAGAPGRSFVADLGPGAARTPARSREFARRLADRAWAARWYRYVLHDQVPAQLRALEAAIAELRPDVLCVDSLSYAGAFAATRTRTPWVSVSTMLLPAAPPDFRCTFTEVMGELEAERNALARSFECELACVHGAAVSPWASAVFATDALLPRELGDARFARAGALRFAAGRGDEPPFPWQRLDGRPIVYVSAGSQHSLPDEALRALAAATSRSPAQLVLSLNDAIDEPWVRELADDTIAVRYAPQLRLLERASVFVTHGGANGVSEAADRGVPQLVVPLCVDQPLQAHLVERAGVGVAVSASEARASVWTDALTTLLDRTGTAIERAAEVARSYQASDGAAWIATRTAALAAGAG
jgi:zeaxanthin glucosyltransferase